MEAGVSCFICNAVDKEVSCVAQFVVRRCDKCGFYGMPTDLAEEMKAHHTQLNVERTRAFLSRRISQQQPPWISALDVQEHGLLDDRVGD
jgi:hypothetical protein